MTITMSEKHQVTIPKNITLALDLKKGSLFKVRVNGTKIELIPVEVVEKKYTKQDYALLDKLTSEQQGKEKKITKAMITKMKKGKW